VDLNTSMVELCRGCGLDAEAGDAVEHLRALPAGSLGAVTGFHVIEHLPFKTFVELLDEALRALASGGAILFETPNPDNVLVGSRNFYLDPTHRNPLPKELPVMIAEARGFARAHARDLHPAGATFNAEDKALGERLDGLFYGPQDYALVAWKP
jgi:O-antigen chain-terminating methyltransferase